MREGARGSKGLSAISYWRDGVLETSQMRRLVAVADHGTITEAAESLYLTQPALSRALQRIEDDLGVSLFDRGRKNELRLNERGRKAAEMARDVLKRVEALERALREGDETSSVVVVGACTPPALWGMLPLLADDFPSVVFSSAIAATTSLEKSLEAGDVNVAFVSRPVAAPDMVCLPWGVERLFAIVPSGHEFYGRKSVSLSELDGQNFLVQDHVGDWLDVLHRYTPASRLLLQEDRATLLGVAEKSSIIRFMSNMTMSFDALLEGEEAVPVTGPGSELPLYCVHDQRLAPALASYLADHSAASVRDAQANRV